MPDWNWGESQSEDGVVHQSTANTDHNGTTVLKQGYDYQNFSEITPGPVACWPLHEDSGSTAYDVAGTNDGTYNGATLGQIGLLGATAPDFDGSDDIVTTADIDVDYITASCWVYLDTVADFETFFADWGGNNSWELDNNNGNWRWVIQTGESFYILEGTAVNTGEWVHLAGVYSSNGMRLYENGVETASRTDITSTLDKTNDGVTIGDTSAGPGNTPMDGRITDCRLYNQGLSASQIQTLYDVVASPGTWTGTAKTL